METFSKLYGKLLPSVPPQKLDKYYTAYTNLAESFNIPAAKRKAVDLFQCVENLSEATYDLASESISKEQLLQINEFCRLYHPKVLFRE